VSVLAKESCYFTIQASSSNKILRELAYGYANYFTFQSGEKKYYLTHNQNLDSIKIIASLNEQNSGQLSLKAMPITDN
jgi:hypothetical protein